MGTVDKVNWVVKKERKVRKVADLIFMLTKLTINICREKKMGTVLIISWFGLHIYANLHFSYSMNRLCYNDAMQA